MLAFPNLMRKIDLGEGREWGRGREEERGEEERVDEERVDEERKGKEGEGRTDDINNPNAPPRANPITPDKIVLPTQDSIAPCIYG